MKILIDTQRNNIILTSGDDIRFVNDISGDFYYATLNDKPWIIKKLHVPENHLPESYSIVDISEVELPDDEIEYKYEYNFDKNILEISDIWKSNQIEPY